MLPSQSLDELVKKIIGFLPQSIERIEKDCQQHIKSVLQSAFEGLDIVSREEFDVQVKVLARTRALVDNLQTQVSALLEKEKNR